MEEPMQHCSLISCVVRDYGHRRLVDSVGPLELALGRLSDKQVVCGGAALPRQRFSGRFIYTTFARPLLG